MLVSNSNKDGNPVCVFPRDAFCIAVEISLVVLALWRGRRADCRMDEPLLWAAQGAPWRFEHKVAAKGGLVVDLATTSQTAPENL